MRVLLIGYGAVGQGLTPLLLKHFNLNTEQVCIIAADDEGLTVADTYDLRFINQALNQQNYREILSKLLAKGDWLINVSVDVSSLALIQWSQQAEVLYLDTCIEPWSGGYRNTQDVDKTTNYALRFQALNEHAQGKPTAIVAHGANPGLVTHFVKAGLLNLAKIKHIPTWESWGDLAQQLGIQVVQIAERDTQQTLSPLIEGEFANTWSADGLISEAWQCAEMGWGSHELTLPANTFQHQYGDKSGIYLNEHSVNMKIKSWVPSCGHQDTYLIAHHESLSIANLLTINGRTTENPEYRPTVYFAYRPADLTCESLSQWTANAYKEPKRKRVMREELHDGFDQLGVLFVFSGGAYWYGSTLHLEHARKLAPYNNATSLQVVAGIIGALEWMQKHPNEGVIEAESMDFQVILDVAMPYLGEVSGVLTDWQPAEDGALQFLDFIMD
ncbi:MAG TPA: saccharopine dehydrogenase NADP-binding domain-containing protein [Methyloradius sp.]